METEQIKQAPTMSFAQEADYANLRAHLDRYSGAFDEAHEPFHKRASTDPAFAIENAARVLTSQAKKNLAEQVYRCFAETVKDYRNANDLVGADVTGHLILLEALVEAIELVAQDATDELIRGANSPQSSSPLTNAVYIHQNDAKGDFIRKMKMESDYARKHLASREGGS